MSPVKIIRYIAIALAVVAAFVTIPYVTLAMVVLGAALGFMGVSADERILYLVVAVALAQVAGALGPIPAVGEYITAIMTNLSTIVNAGAAAVILTMTKERLMD
jgi:small-conductance mechanosensitive channel